MIRQRALRFRSFLLIFEVGELRFPVVSQVVHPAREIQQALVTRTVIKPDDAQHFIVPAKDGTLLRRPVAQMPGLEREVLPHQGNDAWIAGRLLVLRQDFQHDVVRPPVGHGCRADPAVRLLVLQGPAHILPGLGDQSLVAGQESQRHQAVQEVGAAFPAFARAAQPAAVRPDIRPELVQVAGQSVRLDLQLAQQPAGRLN